MCWKQEWAMAINNLNHAIIHVEKAQAKLIHRKDRNEKYLQHLLQNRRIYSSAEEAGVNARITKNQQGIDECTQLIEIFKQQQDHLFRMVHIYGINKSKTPKKVYQLMGKYPIPNAVMEGTQVIFQRKKQ